MTTRQQLDDLCQRHTLMVQMDYDGCEANTDMMPGTPDLTITGEPVKVELEDEL